MNDKYCIYCHTNKINGKKYIGQTKMNVNKRWRNGLGYISSPLFYNSIQKYGWDSFTHEILMTGLSLEEANKYEEELIKEYHTNDKDLGYNIRSGGENQEWSKESKEKLSKIKSKQIDENPKKYNRKAVCRYSLSGEYIDTYKSAEYASKIFCIAESSIKSCCHKYPHNKTAGGYIWRYECDNTNVLPYKENRGGKNKKPVIQLDMNENIVKIWESASAVERAINIKTSQIIGCCRGRCQTAGGYKWKYLER